MNEYYCLVLKIIKLIIIFGLIIIYIWNNKHLVNKKNILMNSMSIGFLFTSQFYLLYIDKNDKIMMLIQIIGVFIIFSSIGYIYEKYDLLPPYKK